MFINREKGRLITSFQMKKGQRFHSLYSFTHGRELKKRRITVLAIDLPWDGVVGVGGPSMAWGGQEASVIERQILKEISGKIRGTCELDPRFWG